MSLSIQFLGGAGTVTGSKFLVQCDQKKILVDCGLFQGLKELRLQNWAPFPIDPSTIDAVLLTHAHLDHTGYLPILKRNGFSGPIYCTHPTRDLSKVILYDSAKIQEEDAERINAAGYSKHVPAKPLYTTEEAESVLSLIRPIEMEKWIPLFDGLDARFTNSGHILGSAFIELRTPKSTIAFTGDLGRPEPLILPPPKFIRKADFLVIESTYGDRVHSPLSPLKELARIINEAIDRKGHIIIPSFAVGRTQDILYLVSVLKNQSQIPNIPIFLDSPMGTDATEIFLKYPTSHRLSVDEVAALQKDVTMVRSQKESESLLDHEPSTLVIAGSGMLTGGRVLAHLLKRLRERENTVVFVGYQAASTRGSLLRAGMPELKIYNQYVPVRARIEEISTLSAHADQKDLIKWMGEFDSPPKKTFIVHGEPQAADALRVRSRDSLGWNGLIIPKQNERFELEG